MPTARRIAASIVGNNERAVQVPLETYHRIDASQVAGPLSIENGAARQWIAETTGDDIATNRDAVLKRGRSQLQ